MDKKKIIEDGLLELYLLGELSQEEQLAVEHALQKDSSLKKIYDGMEEDFQKMAFENAVEPPSSIKTSLKQTLESSVEEPPVRKLETAMSESGRSYLPMAAAASLALLFALSSFWLYNRWKTSENSLLELQEQTSDLQNRLNDLEKNYQDTNQKYRKINDPNVIPLLLVGNATAPNSQAVAYVNHKTKEVVVNPQGLQELEADKTYQMWADVDGEMIDMGIVSNEEDLITLKYIDKAESLNITIEPTGGSDHATVENLVANVLL